LLERIEGRMLTQPTLVRLEIDDRPLAEAVRALADQVGAPLALGGDDAAEEGARRITARAAEPIPFWRALDRLGLTGGWGLEYRPAPFREDRTAPFPVLRRDIPTIRICDRGPFRVVLRGPGEGGGRPARDLIVGL